MFKKCESKYCSDVRKKYFNKNVAMTKEDDEDFKNSIKCWICYNIYVVGDDKVIVHCDITRKYRGYAHRHSIVISKLNQIKSCSTTEMIKIRILLYKN